MGGIIIHKDAEVKYSTVQNWFPGDNNTGGILNFVTKRALCEGENSKMSWTQSETGSAITWKYPSCILRGDNSIGEFYSVALTSGHQQADTGTKMIHIGKNHALNHYFKRHFRRPQPEQLPWAGKNYADGKPTPEISPNATPC
ncbi:Iron-sulfur cluster assembly protein SufB [Salmonella enterica subsp. enterica]|uniref:Iron-sulfur cluster assembly protein SufB n=1 Tax=Salmonella enterica I TaxID=59201 RepID=A0A447MTH8_SALET|nr:Iron-sulfur cluster assembly protein SufB [Salmonella enterica subsp. enterica]